jgi:predicted lipoprotein with Yx(FWY)xxD motif
MQIGRTVTGSSAGQRAAGSSGRQARFSIFAAGALTVALSLTALVGPASASPRPGLSARAMVAVKAATVANYGKILENQKGLPLYYDTADKPPKHLDCTGGCLSAWPPLVLPKGQTKVAVGKGVTGISTIKDPSGVQVTWKGKPLYTFASDSTGNVTGNGVGNFKVVRLS